MGQEEIFFYNSTNFLFKLKGFFPKDVLLDLREDIAAARKAIVTDVSDERSLAANKVGIAPDCLRLNQKWYDIWKKADLSMWPQQIQEFSHIIYPPQIRTVTQSDYFVPWHQDEAYIRALGDRGHKRFLVCFLPLEDNLNERPTLQFCRNANQEFVEHITRPEYRMNQFDIRDEDQPCEEERLTVPLELGDVLLFGSHVFHRTYYGGDNMQQRRSLEFRFTDAPSTLNDKDYYDLNQQQFYYKE